MASAAILVLVVEDDFSVLDVVEHALVDAGFEVVHAAAAAEALSLIEQFGSDYRALVTDINLDKGDDVLTGWDIARRAREANPSLAVVYMTGAEADKWASEGVPNSLLLTKPFANAQLVTAVSQLINAAGTQQAPS